MSRRQAYQLGLDAEALVASYLEDEGFFVVERNYQAAGGEIDLIVQRKGSVRFVEVKARPPGDDRGLESIHGGKQARLRRAAEAWLAEKNVEEAAFLVALVWVPKLGEPWIEWIDDAF